MHLVLLITNCIFIATVIKMWNTLNNHKFMRKNECLMITKVVMNFSLSITQLLGNISDIVGLLMEINGMSNIQHYLKVTFYISLFDLINVIADFFTYFFLTLYLWWLLGLDETRFRGKNNDFKVSANVKTAEIKLDLMQRSDEPRLS